jgi:hypothetical protein
MRTSREYAPYAGVRSLGRRELPQKVVRLRSGKQCLSKLLYICPMRVLLAIMIISSVGVVSYEAIHMERGLYCGYTNTVESSTWEMPTNADKNRGTVQFR